MSASDAGSVGDFAATEHKRNPLRTFFGSLRTQLTLALWLPAVAAVAALVFVAVTTANEWSKDRQVTTVLEMGNEIQDYLDAVNTEQRAAFGLAPISYDDAVKKTDDALQVLFDEIDSHEDQIPPDLLSLADDLRANNMDDTTTLRALVAREGVPAPGVLGAFFEMRAITSEIPSDFANQVSSEETRDILAAMAMSWDLSARLDREQILVELWAKGEGNVTGTDVAAAIWETRNLDRAAPIVYDRLATPYEVGGWSEDVDQGRQMLAATNGLLAKDSSKVARIGLDIDSYVSQVENRATQAHATSQAIVAEAVDVAHAQDSAARNSVLLAAGLAILVVLVSAAIMPLLTRRIVNPIVSLVADTRKRARELPAQLESIERGVAPAVLEPLSAGKAGPELRAFAGAVNNLVDNAVDLATKEAQQRAAVVGMLRTVAHREAALVNRQLELLDKYERHEVDPVFLSRLFNLDHVTTQMRRMCDSLLVLAGASPVRRTTPPLSLVDVVRGASSQIQQYSRVDLDVWYDPRVHGHKVSDLTLLLAELLDNATKYSHPDTRVTVTFTRGTEGALVTIADQGIGFDDAALTTAQELVDATDPDHFAMFDRLGLQTVARLCQRTGATVTFTGGTDIAGTRVAVRIPDALLSDASGGTGLKLTNAASETFDDSVNRPATATLYGQQVGGSA